MRSLNWQSREAATAIEKANTAVAASRLSSLAATCPWAYALIVIHESGGFRLRFWVATEVTLGFGLRKLLIVDGTRGRLFG